MLPNLVAVFAQVNGQWQGYGGPNVLSLDTLEQGAAYWMYADIKLSPWGPTVPLYKGWNLVAWVYPTTPIEFSLGGYENVVPFIIKPGSQEKPNALYQSPMVVPLSVLQKGQTYNTFVQEPGNPFPDMSTYTH